MTSNFAYFSTSSSSLLAYSSRSALSMAFSASAANLALSSLINFSSFAFWISSYSCISCCCFSLVYSCSMISSRFLISINFSFSDDALAYNSCWFLASASCSIRSLAASTAFWTKIASRSSWSLRRSASWPWISSKACLASSTSFSLRSFSAASSSISSSYYFCLASASSCSFWASASCVILLSSTIWAILANSSSISYWSASAWSTASPFVGSDSISFINAYLLANSNSFSSASDWPVA